MKRDSYSNQQAHASFQPRSPKSAIDPTQLGQPTQHSSSTSNMGAKWLNKANSWVADKWQTAQNFVSSGDTVAPDQILPALKGTVSLNQPLVGVIDSGFGANEHGSKMVEAIQKENPQAQIWKGGSVGTGKWSESLVEFVDTAKADGHSRAVANLSFDLTEVHPDGSVSTRTQLTAEEQSALAYARDNGVLVIASAGNQGGAMSALGQASQPSDNLIVVGAANGSDSSGVAQSADRASYSSYGNGLDLVADVGTAGTSEAAAKVTGAIANIWSANPGLNSQQVNQILTTTATDLKTPGRDAETGAGLLNSTGAIDLATHTTPEAIVFSGAQLIQQSNKSSGNSTWRSTNGAVASERTAGLAADIVRTIPGVGAAVKAVSSKPKNIARAIPGVGTAVKAVSSKPKNIARAIPGVGAAVKAVNPKPQNIASAIPGVSAAVKAINPKPKNIASVIPGVSAVVKAVNPKSKNIARPVALNNGFDSEFRRFAQDYQLDPRKGFWDTLGDVVSKSTRLDDRKYLPGLDHPVGRVIQDYNVGVGKFLHGTGAGFVSLANNPAVQSISNPALGALNQALRPQETNQAYKDMGEGFVSLVSNPAVQSLLTLGLADGINYTLRPEETLQAKADMVKPFTDAINSGHPAEAVGYGLAAVGSLFVPVGGAVGGASRATSITSRAATRPAITALPPRPAITAPPPRLAIEGRTTARPLYDRGARPGPGQRSLTQEQWKQLREDQRANQNVQRIPGHGHERHGSQVTTQQLIDRVQNGLLPNGTTRSAPNRATRFDSARRELEAVVRARAELRAGRPMYKVNSRGEVEVDSTLIVPGSRGGYGRGVEVQREAAAAGRGTRRIRVDPQGEAKVIGKENSGSQPPALPGRPVRPTTQDSHAHVRFEYDSRAGRWKENTHFPAPPNQAK